MGFLQKPPDRKMNMSNTIGNKKLAQATMIFRTMKAQENIFPQNRKMPLLTNSHNFLAIAKWRDMKRVPRIEAEAVAVALERTS